MDNTITQATPLKHEPSVTYGDEGAGSGWNTVWITKEDAALLYDIAATLSEQASEFSIDFGFGTVTMKFNSKESEYDWE